MGTAGLGAKTFKNKFPINYIELYKVKYVLWKMNKYWQTYHQLPLISKMQNSENSISFIVCSYLHIRSHRPWLGWPQQRCMSERPESAAFVAQCCHRSLSHLSERSLERQDKRDDSYCFHVESQHAAKDEEMNREVAVTWLTETDSICNLVKINISSWWHKHSVAIGNDCKPRDLLWGANGGRQVITLTLQLRYSSLPANHFTLC